MKPLLDFGRALELDRATRALYSLGEGILLEKASLRLWDSLALWIEGEGGGKPRPRILALCGKGDNGSDALAMLRHASSSGFPDLAAILSPDRPQSGRDPQADSLRSAGIEVLAWESLEPRTLEDLLSGCGILIDGILGTGCSGPPRGGAKAMIEALEALGRRAVHPLIASVDLPSGLNEGYEGAWPCVRADVTLALEPCKIPSYSPLGRKLCGTILPVQDVFPAGLAGEGACGRLLEEGDLRRLAPAVPPHAYKSSRGRLAIFAGSDLAPGAARLCVKGAAASGAGYIILYADAKLGKALLPDVESAVLRDPESFDPGNPGCDVILAGPGWGSGPRRKELLLSIFDSGLPLVLDADALRILALHPELAVGRPGLRLLTPHPGEFEAFFAKGIPCPGTFRERLAELSARLGSAILLKGHVSWIFDGDQVRVWDGMRPELGVAGSGDVLAGLAAGILASYRASGAATDRSEGLLLDAASCAVIVHAMAGKRLAVEKGWFEAQDLPAVCAKILHSYARELSVPGRGGAELDPYTSPC